MERDPVCGMQVDPAGSAYVSEHQGRTFYFCSEACKRKFDQDPTPYVGQETGGSRSVADAPETIG